MNDCYNYGYCTEKLNSLDSSSNKKMSVRPHMHLFTICVCLPN